MIPRSPFEYSTRPPEPVRVVVVDGVDHPLWQPIDLTTDDYFAFQDVVGKISAQEDSGKDWRRDRTILEDFVRAIGPTLRGVDLSRMRHVELMRLVAEAQGSMLGRPPVPAKAPAPSESEDDDSAEPTTATPFESGSADLRSDNPSERSAA
jgi:hypothetical protein